LDCVPERKPGSAANAIERREHVAVEAEFYDYEPGTQRDARVHAVRQAWTGLGEMRAQLERARCLRSGPIAGTGQRQHQQRRAAR